MQQLGYSIAEPPKAKQVLSDKHAIILGTQPLPTYVPLAARGAPTEEDLFRIGKIVEAYQNRPEITEIGEARRAEIEKLVSKYLALLRARISEDKRKLYCEMAFTLTGAGLGPLDFLLTDPEIEEIMANGAGKPIYVYHRKAGMCRTTLSFGSAEYLAEKANQMLFPLNKRVDESKPAGHGILPNGDRVTVELPPISREPALDIRRFSAEPLTLPALVARGMLDWRMAGFLSIVFEAGGTNVGVIGNTGAGKTTLLGALLRAIPPHQRIVSVEEIPEMRVPHEQSVRLLEAEHLGIRMADCILETLRLRPDRVVVGEVRSPADALALRDSCLSGQSFGTYYTYHADDSAAAADRLASQGVSRTDLRSFGLLVCCRRYEDEMFRTRRVVTEISEGGVPLFRYDFRKGLWTAGLRGRSAIESWLARTHLKGKRLASEIAKREKLLKSLAEASDSEFFRKYWAGRA